MSNFEKTKEEFYRKYGDMPDASVLKEILMRQIIIAERLDANRSNTNKLVWWLVAVPYIIGFIIFIRYVMH